MHSLVPQKKCFKCDSVKPLGDFYKHPGMADGRVNKCKECNKVDVVENRLSNIDRYREYDKYRFANSPKRRKDIYERAERYSSLNPEKRKAHWAVNNAVRDRRLEKASECSMCGDSSGRIEGHHDDYSKPLEVVWLCKPCHYKIHAHSKHT
jgi:hypothetical protein